MNHSNAHQSQQFFHEFTKQVLPSCMAVASLTSIASDFFVDNGCSASPYTLNPGSRKQEQAKPCV